MWRSEIWVTCPASIATNCEAAFCFWALCVLCEAQQFSELCIFGVNLLFDACLRISSFNTTKSPEKPSRLLICLGFWRVRADFPSQILWNGNTTMHFDQVHHWSVFDSSVPHYSLARTWPTLVSPCRVTFHRILCPYSVIWHRAVTVTVNHVRPHQL